MQLNFYTVYLAWGIKIQGKIVMEQLYSSKLTRIVKLKYMARYSFT